MKNLLAILFAFAFTSAIAFSVPSIYDNTSVGSKRASAVITVNTIRALTVNAVPPAELGKYVVSTTAYAVTGSEFSFNITGEANQSFNYTISSDITDPAADITIEWHGISGVTDNILGSLTGSATLSNEVSGLGTFQIKGIVKTVLSKSSGAAQFTQAIELAYVGV